MKSERVITLPWQPIATCPALPGKHYTVGNWDEESGCMDIRVARWVNGCDFLEIPIAERPFDVEEQGWWELLDTTAEDRDAFGQPKYWLDA